MRLNYMRELILGNNLELIATEEIKRVTQKPYFCKLSTQIEKEAVTAAKGTKCVFIIHQSQFECEALIIFPEKLKPLNLWLLLYSKDSVDSKFMHGKLMKLLL